MKNKKLIEFLSEAPEDFDIVLSEVIVPFDDEEYEVYVDIPMCGIAVDEETKEIRFMVDEHNKEALDNILTRRFDNEN